MTTADNYVVVPRFPKVMFSLVFNSYKQILVQTLTGTVFFLLFLSHFFLIFSMFLFSTSYLNYYLYILSYIVLDYLLLVLFYFRLLF